FDSQLSTLTPALSLQGRGRTVRKKRTGRKGATTFDPSTQVSASTLTHVGASSICDVRKSVGGRDGETERRSESQSRFSRRSSRMSGAISVHIFSSRRANSRLVLSQSIGLPMS